MPDPRDSFYRQLDLDEKSKEALKVYRFLKKLMIKDSIYPKSKEKK